MNNTHFLLDSGDPKEYREIAILAKEHGSEIWGATTNPTLIAKNLGGQKLTSQQAFALQKEIVEDILEIVPGAVSAEVYADDKTSEEDMIRQGEEIATWHERIYVKLPTNIAGFKARTVLREKNIPINNTLVFSQEQIFAICLHEKIIQKTNNKTSKWPPFISPFIGRLDDKGENGMKLIENGMKIKEKFTTPDKKPITWMLASSVRKIEHIKRSIELGSEIITAPGKAYKEWFALDQKQQDEIDTSSWGKELADIPVWQIPSDMASIETMDDFMQAIESNNLDIRHTLTQSGIERFAMDWQAILNTTQN